MAIKYNPNKWLFFNGYIESANTNLKTARNRLEDILTQCTFPSKTIIGRKFDKKSVIRSCSNSVYNMRLDLLTVKSDVIDKVFGFLKAEEKSKSLTSSLKLTIKGVTDDFANNMIKLRLTNSRALKENGSKMPIEECLRLAKEEYKKNGKSEKYYYIISQNYDWFWYETKDGKIVRPGSVQYEYYKSIGEYMDLKTSEELVELLDEISGRDHKEYENDIGYYNYILNGFVKADFIPTYKKYDNTCNGFYNTNFDGWYGTDQGMFKDEKTKKNVIRQIHYKEHSFSKATDYLMDEYGMSYFDAADTLKALDSIGACSYAAAVNQIIYVYKDKPDEFEKTFGFPMYDAEDGQLNDEILLADIYIYANEGKSFNKETDKKTNKKTVTLKKENFYYTNKKNSYRKKVEVKDQNYLSTSAGIEVDVINNYINSKNSSDDNIQFDETLFDTQETKELSNTQIKNIVENSLQNGNGIGVGIYASEEKPTIFNTINEPYHYVLDGAHAVTVTDVVEEGIVVSSWGKRFIITYDELKKNKFRISVLTHN